MDVLVLTTSFHKSNIGWPQQPPIEKGAKIQHDISWFMRHPVEQTQNTKMQGLPVPNSIFTVIVHMVYGWGLIKDEFLLQIVIPGDGPISTKMKETPWKFCSNLI